GLRRFNAAFLGGYRMNPTRLRRSAPRTTGDATQVMRGRASTRPVAHDAITLNLGYRAPYDVDALLAFLLQRAIPGVETIAGRTIRRSVRAGVLGPSAGWIEARFPADTDRVQLSFAPSLAAASAAV